MKIAHVYFQFYPCEDGTSIEVYHISRKLVEREHDVTVITSNLMFYRQEKLPETETIDGIKVRRFPVRFPYPISKFVFTPSLIRGISSIEADVFHVFTYLPMFLINYATFYAIQKGIPLVLTPIYHPARQTAYKGILSFLQANFYDRLVGPRILRRADCITAYSPADGSFYSQIGAKDVCVRGMGVDEAECPPEALEDFTKRYNLTENTILSANRLERRKGIQHIIEAMPMILKEYPDTRLLVAGEDMGFKRYLDELVARIGVEASVVFTGHLSRSEVPCAFKVSKMFLLPSYYDVLPLAPLEAWLHKIPIVISSKVWGTADLVTPENGIVIKEPSHYKAIAEAVVELLSNPRKSQAMGENGHRLVEEQFTWDSVVDKIEAVYKTVTSRRRELST